MPKIKIIEEDLTSPGNLPANNDIVYIPGFVSADDISLRGSTLVDAHVPTLCTSVDDFYQAFGEHIPEIKDGYTYESISDVYRFSSDAANITDNLVQTVSVNGTPVAYDKSFIMAAKLTSLGFSVLYERVNETADEITLNHMYNQFIDKDGHSVFDKLSSINDYDVKYITSGGYPILEYNRGEDSISVTSEPAGHSYTLATNGGRNFGDMVDYISGRYIATYTANASSEESIGYEYINSTYTEGAFVATFLNRKNNANSRKILPVASWAKIKVEGSNASGYNNIKYSYINSSTSEETTLDNGVAFSDYGLLISGDVDAGDTFGKFKLASDVYFNVDDTYYTLSKTLTPGEYELNYGLGTNVTTFKYDGNAFVSLDNGHTLSEYGYATPSGFTATTGMIIDVYRSVYVDITDITAPDNTPVYTKAVEYTKTTETNIGEFTYGASAYTCVVALYNTVRQIEGFAEDTVITINKTSDGKYVAEIDDNSVGIEFPANYGLIYDRGDDTTIVTINAVSGQEQQSAWVMNNKVYTNLVSTVDTGDCVFVTSDTPNVGETLEIVYTSTTNTLGAIASKMIDAASMRTDAVALLDTTDNPDRVIAASDNDAIFNKINKTKLGNGEYGAVFYPWYTHNDGFTYPGSFAYLTSLAESLRNNPAWLAIAGVARGQVPNLAGLHLNKVLSNKIADDYQPRSGGASINPITDIKPYGYTIWGNRTLKDNSENLTATSFLNIRNLLCDIKKVCYKAARRFTFEQNSDILWINFKQAIAPTLEAMVSGFGLSGYKILKVPTTEKAKLCCKIILYPLYAVEDFEITISLQDEDITVVE